MNPPVPLEAILRYLLEILGIDPKEFPERAPQTWRPLLNLAAEETIDLYLAAWFLRDWGESVPPDLRVALDTSLRRNEARNALLKSQVAELAVLFGEAGIPAMFLKGAAGLVRELYPLACRQVLDIDVLVPLDRVGDSRRLLRSEGYEPRPLKFTLAESFQHIERHWHRARVADVEIHFRPYPSVSSADPVMTGIWDDAESLALGSARVTVPSVTDHAWILMRTDMLGRPFFPRLRDAIETHLILKNGHSVDFGLIARRAESDGVPNIVRGMSCACTRYLGMAPFASTNGPLPKRWEKWSLEFNRRRRSGRIKHPEHLCEFAAMRFLPDGRIASRIRFMHRVVRCEYAQYPQRFLYYIGVIPDY